MKFNWVTMGHEKHAKIGDYIEIHFIGKFEDESVFETSHNGLPLKFKVGNNEVIQGIDEAVVGMKIGQVKIIHISADKAYGSIDKNLIISIEKDKLPKDSNLTVGKEMKLPNEDGLPFSVRVANVNNKVIELDGNHPLAGKNLIFELKLISIR